MKKVQFEVKKAGRPAINDEAFSRIKNEKRQRFIVYKYEWLLKEAPGAFLLRKKTGLNFKVQTLINNEGWLLTRL